MRKRLISAAIAFAAVIGLAVVVFPVSRAAVEPYFITVNDTTLIPFNTDNMPFLLNGLYFLPPSVFENAGINAFSSVSDQQTVLAGGGKSLIFQARHGNAIDQDGNVHWWQSRIVSNRFYVPLSQVAHHFDLTYEIIRTANIIPDTQISIIRINPRFNLPTFLGWHDSSIRDYYNSHFGNNLPPVTPDPPGNGGFIPPPPPPPPNFSDVSIYLSFYNLSAGGAEKILDTLEISGFRGTFFVSADDISENPGLVRRIAGSGHTIGLWIWDGIYFEEFREASSLLFEAAKLTTALVSTNLPPDPDDLPRNLIFWRSPPSSEGITASAIINTFPTVSRARHNLLLSCSENTAEVLPVILSHLRAYDYTARTITEITEPINN